MRASRCLRLFTRTSFAGFDRHPFVNGLDEQALCERDKKNAERDFAEALRRHVKDHRRLYEPLRAASGRQTQPASHQRTAGITPWAASRTMRCTHILFHYGRYLMITSSREGTQAMNLQGIWNEHLCAPWRANYTLKHQYGDELLAR